MQAQTRRSINTWEFDAAGLANVLVTRRTENGLSTRELSRRAGISQAYVVALERAHAHDGERTPTPTIDVLARLADALRMSPEHILRLAVRRSGQHVLLLVEEHERTSPLAVARRIAADDVEWVQASSSIGQTSGRHPHHHIDLRRTQASAYEPATIARSLRNELEHLRPAIEGRRLGLLFTETSDVMVSIDDPDIVLRFEHDWDHVVKSAAHQVGAHAAWNVCVYEMPAIRRLHEPLQAMTDLVRSHDTVWYSRRSTVLKETPAVHRAFEQLRPEGVQRADWDETTTDLLVELGYAATQTG